MESTAGFLTLRNGYSTGPESFTLVLNVRESECRNASYYFLSLSVIVLSCALDVSTASE